MRERRYAGNSRIRSLSPRRRRLSPPFSGRDFRYSPSRRRGGMDMEEERRGGKCQRRYLDKRYDHRGDRDHERNFNRGDRYYDPGFSRGGARISGYDGGNRERDGDRGRDVDGGRFGSMYQPSGDGEYSRRLPRYSPGLPLGDSTSSKVKWDHLFDEPRKSEGFKGSIDHGTGSGVRNGLEDRYDRSKFFESGPADLGLDRKPMSMSMEAERGRVYSSSYQMDLGGVPKSPSQVGVVGGSMSLQSGYLNSSIHKDEDFHFRDKLHLDKVVADGPLTRDPLARDTYRKDYHLPYPRTDHNYTGSSSCSKTFEKVPPISFKEDIPGSLRQDLRLPSDGVRLSSGMITNPIGYNDYGAKARTRSPMDREGKLENLRSSSRSYFEIAEERHRNFAYPEVGQAEGGSVGTRSTEPYGKMEGVREDYGRQDVSRLPMLEPILEKVDGSSPHGYLRGNRLWNPPPPSLGQLTTNFHGGRESLHARRQEVDYQGYGSPRTTYEKEFYHSNGSSRMGELQHDYGIGGSTRSPHRQTDRFPTREYDSHLDNFDSISQQKMPDNVRFPRPSKETLKRRRGMEKQVSKHGCTTYDLGDACEPWREDIDSNILSKKRKFSKSNYGKTRKASDVAYHQVSSGTSSLFVPRHFKKPHKFGTRDIKKRLGPGPQKLHVSQRLVMKYKPSLSKRLGPAPQKNHVTLPWLKNRNASKLPRIQDVSDGSHLDQGEEPHEDNVTLIKPEPPESSEDFRQMVFNAFFKFVKLLNETPAKRRKYNGQGKVGSLKCIVCGSNSEEFGAAESLAMHAFTSEKVGVRAQHLGFHKALCSLNGWKSAEAFNSAWICETLSRADHLSLKEDLILWPPAVIVHNSSIGNQSPDTDQRVIVSVGELEAKLRDMGFGDKMKVYRGKPANQSVMVVQFGGTLSGLQEAERLHKIYVESKHGRAEFLKARPCNNGNHNGEAKVATVEKILYGHLGIAEDLDKLDFDVKRRCVIKSKKDIQDIAEAPFKGK